MHADVTRYQGFRTQAKKYAELDGLHAVAREEAWLSSRVRVQPAALDASSALTQEQREILTRNVEEAIVRKKRRLAHAVIVIEQDLQKTQ